MAELIKAAKESGGNTVFLTGAGISTSAGVADFRGPNGVWTAEKAGKPPPPSADFDQAVPTTTHMALAALVGAGYAKLVVSQNVDGLHLRSGIARDKLSEIHGNIFMEKCEKCGKEQFREFDVGGMSFQPTGRVCDAKSCKGRLVDQVSKDENNVCCGLAIQTRAHEWIPCLSNRSSTGTTRYPRTNSHAQRKALKPLTSQYASAPRSASSPPRSYPSSHYQQAGKWSFATSRCLPPRHMCLVSRRVQKSATQERTSVLPCATPR